jgi:GTP-binding protein EngB required for normal cell division
MAGLCSTVPNSQITIEIFFLLFSRCKVIKADSGDGVPLVNRQAGLMTPTDSNVRWGFKEEARRRFFEYLNTPAASLALNILTKCSNENREEPMTQAAPPPFCRQTPQLSDLLAKTAGIISDLGLQFLHYRQKVESLASRLSQGRFHLAVLGQFKRGKSTLLNALTGEPILPVGVVPLTAAPTFLQYGEAAKITIEYKDGRPAEEFSGFSTAERRAFLAGFVTEKGNPKNKLSVAEVQVDLPAPILTGGVVLIDTPGIGSTYRHNTSATLNFLEQCDAALFLVSADPPITEVELEFLRQVSEKVPRLFFVLNKIDYLDDSELEEALAFYKHVLSEELGWNRDHPVFSVSARSGLEARTSTDARGWSASGMARLESFLVDYLAREKFNALTEAVCQRALEFVDAVLMEAGVALRALKEPQQQLEEKIAVFEQTRKQAESERRLIQDVLEGDKKRVTAYVEEAARELARQAEQSLKEIMNRGPGSRSYGQSAKTGIQQAWAEAIPDYFEEQRHALNGRIQERLIECLTPHEERLFKLVETLRRTAAGMFQVPYKPLSPKEVLEVKRRPYWVLSTWNTDSLPVLQSMDQRMDGLVRRNVENIRWSMLQNLNLSFAGFARRTRERLDETVAATQGAMQAAYARRQAGDGSIEVEASRMADLMAALEAAKIDLTVFQNNVSPASEPKADNRM